MNDDVFHIVAFGGINGGANGYASILIMMIDGTLIEDYPDYENIPYRERAILVKDTIRNGIADGVDMYLSDTFVVSVIYAVSANVVDANNINTWVESRENDYRENGGRSTNRVVFTDVIFSLDFIEAVIKGEHYVDRSDDISFDTSYLTQEELVEMTSSAIQMSTEEIETMMVDTDKVTVN